MDLKIYDNINNKLHEGLKESISSDCRLSIAGSVFSIYAYEALQKELDGVANLRFLYTSPTFAENKEKKAVKEFFIPRQSRERALFGSPFEIKLRNQLTQRAIARECADWIRRCCTFKECRVLVQHRPHKPTCPYPEVRRCTGVRSRQYADLREGDPD